jgi:ATP-dependent DNA helicase DinG
MAEAVGRAIEERRDLVVQAGTGTGKSLAYLVPAVLSGKKVVVATATKALQDQLATKDLPFLARQLGSDHPFTFSVLKGRSNYLCRQRAAESIASPGQVQRKSSATGATTADGVDPEPKVAEHVAQSLFEPQGDTPEEPKRRPSPMAAAPETTVGADIADPATLGLGRQVKALIEWADGSPTGDKAELPWEPTIRAWAAVSVGARECPGAFRCPMGSVCFAEQARQRAAASDVIVVNTHLYAAHVASGGAVLPEHEVLVLDEAHEVEDIMAQGLGLELTGGRLRALAAQAGTLIATDDSGPSGSRSGAPDQLSQVADMFDNAVKPLAGTRVLRRSDRSSHDRQRSDQPSSTSGPEPEGLELVPGIAGDRRVGTGNQAPGEDVLVEVLELAQGRIGSILEGLRRADTAGDGDLETRKTRAVLAATHLQQDLQSLAACGAESVAWVETNGNFTVLKMTPVEVGPLLAERVWPDVTAILTSATIPSSIGRRLGLPDGKTDSLDVGSPFPYKDRALLYCPRNLPDRRSPLADAQVHKEMETLIRAAGGRSLVLFTSWRAMKNATDELQPKLPYRILTQGELPKWKLVEEFTAEHSTCLFATMSFWQGVDVPGATLSLVILDRLPFPRPDEPLLQARRDLAGSRAFFEVDIPRAGTMLAQGVGRLVRSAEDTGVVAVLDSRLATANYRHQLLKGVPPLRRTIDQVEVVAMLEGIAKKHDTEDLAKAQ